MVLYGRCSLRIVPAMVLCVLVSCKPLLLLPVTVLAVAVPGPGEVAVVVSLVGELFCDRILVRADRNDMVAETCNHL